MTRKTCGHVHAEAAPIDRRRRTLMTLIGSGLAAMGLDVSRPADAKSVEMEPSPDDQKFMRLALAEAARGDFPFGAVIVREGKILGVGYNMGVSTDDPTAHGEMVAIRTFLGGNPAALLQGATLYTTGEPCPMCMGAIVWCGFSRIVYAASIEQLATRMGQIMVTSRSIADATPFATISVTGGILAEEALALFKK